MAGRASQGNSDTLDILAIAKQHIVMQMPIERLIQCADVPPIHEVSPGEDIKVKG